jgi:hypothetical protein
MDFNESQCFILEVANAFKNVARYNGVMPGVMLGLLDETELGTLLQRGLIERRAFVRERCAEITGVALTERGLRALRTCRGEH